jgi:predicted nucleic acid-binding protein
MGLILDSSFVIGANDMWIAATTIANGFCLVTSDHAEFSRVPGLVVEGY